MGWVSGNVLPTAIEISLISTDGHSTSETQLGEVSPRLSTADMAMLGVDAPPGAGAGFAFSVSVPDGAAGAATLRLVARTPSVDHVADVGLVLLAKAGMPAALPRPDPDAIRFYLDAPLCKEAMAIEPVRGFLSLVGWAIGRHGIDRIEVFVDGVSQGRAYHGVRREDLRAAFPGVEAARAGFAMVLPPHVMKPGVRAIRVDICDKAGHIKEISFSVRAEAQDVGPGPWQLRKKLPQAEIDLLTAMVQAGGGGARWTCLLLLADATPASLAALRITLDSLRWQALETWSAVLLTERVEDVARVTEALTATHDDLLARLRILPPARGRQLAELTEGFLVALTPGDELGEDALLELAIEVARRPEFDFIYSDERRVDPAGGAEKAFFKPAFSPDLLLSTNYIGRLWAAAGALVARVGLRESDVRTYGEYDAVLRLTERAHGVGHVAKVLARRSGRRGETAAQERHALTRALRRRHIDARVVAGPIRGTWRVRRRVAAAVRARAMVSIIIPTIAAGGRIRTAIETIRANTDWPNYEIICLDTIPAEAAPALACWKRWIAAHADRVIEVRGAFNWSRLNNLGAEAASGGFLLFLNDDIEVHDPTWLTNLVAQAQRPEVGVVGPQLLYPDGRVQHAGMFLARNAGRHAFRFLDKDEPGPFGLARIQREVISVTGAAMMMRREVYDRLRGFDERHRIVNNDLDFNLRARAAGLSVIYTPAVSLIHHEAVSRGHLSDIFDNTAFAERWGDLFLKGDPFFSQHFSPDTDGYEPDSEPTSGFIAGAPLFAGNKIRRIVAIKVDHIGDFITAFPAFRRIKQHFPQAELTVVAPRASLQLAALEPAIDRLIEFNFFHARSDRGRRAGGERSLAALRAQLAPMRFDLGIDLRRQSDTRPILQATGARWLAGFETGYKHPWLDITLEFEGDLALCVKRGHIGAALTGLVDHVAAQCSVDREIVTRPMARHAARDELERMLKKLASDGKTLPALGDKIVCVHTGAGATNKRWPAASFAGLVDLLVGEADASVLLIGGADEKDFAKSILKIARRAASLTNLVGLTRLAELPSVLRAADLYVGNDSGPKHLAAALGVPTIGIHSGTVDPVEWGAMGPRALSIRRTTSCSPCYLTRTEDCHRDLACLNGIRVDEVFAACERMLLFTIPISRVTIDHPEFAQAAQ